MTWTTLLKNLSLRAPPTAHGLKRAGVVGMAPGVASFGFTPSELFGAAARCLHLHIVSPAHAGPEARIVSALVEEHVDDVSSDFFVLASADRFKDYAKSYFSGTLAAGLAYLAMIADGYVWADHFENQRSAGPGTGAPGIGRTPDFVFGRPGVSDVSLVESKGTRSAGWTTFDHTVEDGYLGQVEPHLGYPVGAAAAANGFAIGAWMTSTTRAELNIHHTGVPVSPAPGSAPGSLATLQRGNYATAMQLVHGTDLARAIREAVAIEAAAFVRFSWLGRDWLARDVQVAVPDAGWGFGRALSSLPRFFAIEARIAQQVLSVSAGDALDFGIEPLPAYLAAAAREAGGAVFSDGLAVLSLGAKVERPERMMWKGGHLAPS